MYSLRRRIYTQMSPDIRNQFAAFIDPKVRVRSYLVLRVGLIEVLTDQIRLSVQEQITQEVELY